MNKRMAVFDQDSGGNSIYTRLKAEVVCNAGLGSDCPVTDSSLTYGDLRLILAELEKEEPEESEAGTRYRELTYEPIGPGVEEN